MEVTKWLIALGKRGRGGTMMSWRNLLLESSWCKSSPVKAVAGRPVASVAIRRATGGCEAYTASKQAVRISSEIFDYCDADAVQPAEGSIRPTVMRGGTGVAGVSSPGHAYQRTSREPRRAPCLSAVWALGAAQPQGTRSPGGEGYPREKRITLKQSLLLPRETGGAGTGRRAVLRVHTTDEGGEPQGSREGRPRYPLEGRDKQGDVSMQ